MTKDAADAIKTKNKTKRAIALDALLENQLDH